MKIRMRMTWDAKVTRSKTLWALKVFATESRSGTRGLDRGYVALNKKKKKLGWLGFELLVMSKGDQTFDF